MVVAASHTVCITALANSKIPLPKKKKSYPQLNTSYLDNNGQVASKVKW